MTAPWTLMYTTRTWRTSHGYSCTITLEQAMRNADHVQLTNIGEAFKRLGYWLRIKARHRHG